MSEFSLFFSLGTEHILDIQGYDHILFVIVLAVVYPASEWKKLLILVTAFTVGHSITLALATLEIIPVNSDLIEFLIPITIFITAVTNISKTQDVSRRRPLNINYLYAVFFGLIHGMGFSNYLRAILGQQESILKPLFAFNVGLEVGQIIIVVGFIIISFIFTGILAIRRKVWNLIISSAVAGIAVTLIIENIYW